MKPFNPADFSSLEDENTGIPNEQVQWKSEPDLRRPEGSFGGDMAVDFKKAGVNLGKTIVGFGDLATGGLATPAAQALGMNAELADERLSRDYSNKRLQQEKEIANTNGAVDRAGAILSRPGAAIGRVVQSAPATALSMVPAIRAGTMAGAIGGTSAVAGGMSAASTAQELTEKGASASDMYAGSAIAGGSTAALTAVGGRYGAGSEASASSLVRGATKAAGANLLTRSAKDTGRVGIEAVSEGFEGIGEEVGRNVGLNQPWDQNAGTAFGEGFAVGTTQAGGIKLATNGYDMLAGNRENKKRNLANSQDAALVNERPQEPAFDPEEEARYQAQHQKNKSDFDKQDELEVGEFVPPVTGRERGTQGSVGATMGPAVEGALVFDRPSLEAKFVEFVSQGERKPAVEEVNRPAAIEYVEAEINKELDEETSTGATPVLYMNGEARKILSVKRGVVTLDAGLDENGEQRTDLVDLESILFNNDNPDANRVVIEPNEQNAQPSLWTELNQSPQQANPWQAEETKASTRPPGTLVVETNGTNASPPTPPQGQAPQQQVPQGQPAPAPQGQSAPIVAEPRPFNPNAEGQGEVFTPGEAPKPAPKSKIKSTPEQFQAVLEKFGGEVPRNIIGSTATGWNWFGEKVYGRAELEKRIDKMAQEDAEKTPATLEAEKALIASYKDAGIPLDKTVFDKEVKNLSADAQSLEEVAARINARLEEEYAKGDEKVDVKVLDKLERWYETMTGERPPVSQAADAAIAKAMQPELSFDSTPESAPVQTQTPRQGEASTTPPTSTTPAAAPVAVVEKPKAATKPENKPETPAVPPKYSDGFTRGMSDDDKRSVLKEIEDTVRQQPNGARDGFIVSMKEQGAKAPAIIQAVIDQGFEPVKRHQINHIVANFPVRLKQARDTLGVTDVDYKVLEGVLAKDRSDAPNTVGGVLGREALAAGGGFSIGTKANVGAKDDAATAALTAGNVDEATRIAAEREAKIQRAAKDEEEAQKRKQTLAPVDKPTEPVKPIKLPDAPGTKSRKAPKENKPDEAKPAAPAAQPAPKAEEAANQKTTPVVTRGKKKVVVPTQVADNNLAKAAATWAKLGKTMDAPSFEDLDYDLRLDAMTNNNAGNLDLDRMNDLWKIQKGRNDKLAAEKEAEEKAAAELTEQERQAEIKRLLEESSIDESEAPMVDYVPPDADETSNDDNGDDTKFSRNEKGEKSDSDDVEKELAEFIGNKLSPRVRVVQSFKDLPRAEREAIKDGDTVQGFVHKGRVWLIADNIAPGSARAVFMHEVGVHLGMESILTPQQLGQLNEKIRQWAAKDDGSVGHRVAKAALARVEKAGTPSNQVESEIAAYFVEEALNAGINPSAMDYKTEFGRWFRKVWSAFKAAVRRLNMVNADKLTPQDIVNLAYGAARLSSNGVFHGTATWFRKFNHAFMGSGEGAQFFGWGSYAAERRGVAEQYREDDVARKALRNVNYSGPEPKIGLQADFIKNAQWYIGGDGASIAAGLHDAKMDLESAFRTVNEYIAELENQPYPSNKTKTKIAELNQEADEMYEAIQYAKTVKAEHFSVAESKNKGVTHFVDTNIKDDEWLDYNAPMSKQSDKVKAAFEKAAKEVMGLDYTPNWEKSKGTGQFMYEDLAQQLGSDKAASEWLDANGIKGIKFLDGVSRDSLEVSARILRLPETLYIGQNEVDPETAEITGRSAPVEVTPETVTITQDGEIYVTSSNNKFATQALLSDYATDAKGTPLDTAPYKKRAKSMLGGLTRNKIIFNDKNIQRVATAIDGYDDSIKFSRADASKLLGKMNTLRDTARDRAPEAAKDAVETISDTMGNLFRRGMYSSMMLHDLADVSKRLLGMDSAKKYADLSSQMAGLKDALNKETGAVGRAFSGLPSDQQLAAQEYMLKATVEGEWGFTPSFDRAVAPRGEAKKRFDALKPETQKVVRDLFDFQERQRKQAADAMTQMLESSYAPMIEKATDDKEKQALSDELSKRVAALRRKPGEGPYIPQMRFGGHIAVGKSKEFLAEEKLAEKTGDYQKLHMMKSNPKHYIFSKHYTAGGAAKARAEYESLYDQAYSQQEDASAPHNHDATWKMMSNVKERLNAALSDETPEEKKAKLAAFDMLQQMYVETLQEHSLRTNRLHRENVAGVKPEEVMEGFMTRARNMNHFIAGLTYNDQIVATLADMRNEVREQDDSKKRAEMQEVRNEFILRHYAVMNERDVPWQTGLLQVTGIWRLLTSPSYYLQYVTQPIAMYVPQIAAKYGYAKANSTAFDAFKQVAGMKRLENGDLDFSDLSNATERKALEDMMSNAIISVGFDQEFGNPDLYGGKMATWNKVTAKMTRVSHRLESFNRLSSGLASFRLAYEDQLKKGKSKEEAYNNAVKSAVEDVRQTYGDYASYNAPRLFMNEGVIKGLPAKVMFQFRKFQVIHLALMGRLLAKAFAGADANEKKLAWKQLGFMFGHYGVLAGGLGMPMASMAMAVLQLPVFGLAVGGVEEDDEQFLKRIIGNDTLATLVTKGVPGLAGLNVQKSIGAGDIANPLMDGVGDSGRPKDDFKDKMFALAGPSIGLAADIAGGIGKMYQGDYYNGLAETLPKGLKNFMKAADYKLGDGVTNSKGDVRLSSEEVSWIDAIAQTAGLNPEKISKIGREADNAYDVQQSFRSMTDKIKKEYTTAAKERDTAAMQEAREKWKEMQAKQKQFGLKPTEMSQLLKAPKKQREREENTVEGVQYTDRNEGLVRSLVDPDAAKITNRQEAIDYYNRTGEWVRW